MVLHQSARGENWGTLLEKNELPANAQLGQVELQLSDGVDDAVGSAQSDVTDVWTWSDSIQSVRIRPDIK